VSSPESEEAKVKVIVFPVLAALALPLDAHSGCKELAAAIDDAQKNIAHYQWERYGTDVTYPERDRDTTLLIGNQLAAIQANLMIMDKAKCPLPTEPIDATASRYQQAVQNCVRASSETRTELCNHANWKMDTIRR
jgi:hypothetical protein